MRNIGANPPSPHRPNTSLCPFELHVHNSTPVLQNKQGLCHQAPYPHPYSFTHNCQLLPGHASIPSRKGANVVGAGVDTAE